MTPTYNLISLADISEQVRPCYVDDAVAEACIAEAQNIDVRAQLGDALFLAIFREGATSDRIAALLDGREYEASGCACGDGGVRVHYGVRKALCYYAYSRIVKTGTNTQTRFGFVDKRDEYSATTSLKERVAAYSDARAVADKYMAGVLDYIGGNAAIYPEYQRGGRMTSGGVRIKMIGK